MPENYVQLEALDPTIVCSVGGKTRLDIIKLRKNTGDKLPFREQKNNNAMCLCIKFAFQNPVNPPLVLVEQDRAIECCL